MEMMFYGGGLKSCEKAAEGVARGRDNIMMNSIFYQEKRFELIL